MTIELGDGLDFDEILQIARWLDITRLMKPELRTRLLAGVSSGLAVTSALQNPQLAWLLRFLPGNLGAELNNVVDLLRLSKELLEASR